MRRLYAMGWFIGLLVTGLALPGCSGHDEAAVGAQVDAAVPDAGEVAPPIIERLKACPGEDIVLDSCGWDIICFGKPPRCTPRYTCDCVPAPTCAPGTADCNQIADDGCEVNLENDVNNCGACGHSCGQTGCVGQGACSSGTCETAPVALPAVPANAINVLDAGALGKGMADDTDTIGINAAIAQAAAQPGGGTVYVPDGTYMIRGDSYVNGGGPAPVGLAGVLLQSNVTLMMSAGATLELIPTLSGNSSVVSATGVNNVAIYGGTIVGDFGTHLMGTFGQACTPDNKLVVCSAPSQRCVEVDPTTQQFTIPNQDCGGSLGPCACTGGEFGMGITINGSSNVLVSGVTIKNTWGDGIVIEHQFAIPNPPPAPHGISLCGVTVTQARRNGVTVVSGSNVWITDSTIAFTGFDANGQPGTLPEDGIDVEATEPAGCEPISGVSIKNCDISANKADGVRITSASFPGCSNTNNSVQDSLIAWNGGNGVYVAGPPSTNNVVQRDFIYGATLYGVFLSGSSSTTVSANTIGGAEQQWDVGISDSPSNTVSGNTLEDNDAVLLYYAADPTAPPQTTNNTIENNVCSPSGIIVDSSSLPGNVVRWNASCTPM
jgi:hypothetical protein